MIAAMRRVHVALHIPTSVHVAGAELSRLHHTHNNNRITTTGASTWQVRSSRSSVIRSTTSVGKRRAFTRWRGRCASKRRSRRDGCRSETWHDGAAGLTVRPETRRPPGLSRALRPYSTCIDDCHPSAVSSGVSSDGVTEIYVTRLCSRLAATRSSGARRVCSKIQSFTIENDADRADHLRACRPRRVMRVTVRLRRS